MIAVLNTGVANASSVLYAIERIGYSPLLTEDPEVIAKSSRLILPGVGTAGALMKKIQALELQECLTHYSQPILGICLGMQAFYESSDESNVVCLGFFPGKVKRIHPSKNMSLPHMGWNQTTSLRESRLLKGIDSSSYFYFVHSFQVPRGPETVALTEYGDSIPSVIESKNHFGTQFHPEKSGEVGEVLLNNFLNL